jgi:molybdopterin molybdotransferase
VALLSVTDARTQILGAVQRLPPRDEPLAGMLDCVLAADLVAPLSLPSWDNSAVDGYAIHSADVTSASDNNPIHLRVSGEVPAGSAATTRLDPLTGVRIFTGAPLPEGADAIVMQEDTRPHHEGYIAVLESVEPGENIRRAGDDVAAGVLVLRAGQQLGPAQIGLAAALGMSRLRIHPRPRVGVLVTGAEIIEPGQSLRGGQIYDANSYTLCALLRQAGCEPVELGIADDTREDLSEKIDYGLSECDAVITVGGVSVGEYDLVKEVLAELGCAQEFWRVAMKPGKPFVFAHRDGRPVFGLPGNPVSAAVTFLILVRPALQKMRGSARLDLPAVQAEAKADFVNPGDRRHFMRARLEESAGQWFVTPVPRQDSHIISSLAEADCLVEVAEATTVRRGTIVPAIRFAG